MAGNLKQRLIKAGRDYNYAEGVKVKADAAIYADQIVYVTGNDGPYLTVNIADADGGVTSGGRMLIAKHDIPSGGYGVCLPWKLVTTVATTGHTIGDPIYLADAPGAAVGSNLTRTCPTGDAKAVVVGRITKVGTVAAGAGILVSAAAPEENVQGGTTSSGSTLIKGCPVEQAMFTLGADGATVTVSFEYPIIVTDVMVICGGATDITDVKVYNGAVSGTDYLATIATNITDEKGVGRAETISDGQQAVAAETVISAVRTGGQAEDAIVITFIRG